jgi:hypothetical protein
VAAYLEARIGLGVAPPRGSLGHAENFYAMIGKVFASARVAKLANQRTTHAILAFVNMSKRSSLNQWPWAVAVLLASCAVAQERSANAQEHTWRGTWMATTGPTHSFRGRWWASLLPHTHSAAYGSWTLLSDTNQILLEGTWSAHKSLRGWQGTWSARVGGGKPFSGTWMSDTTDVRGKTFEDMLKGTLEKQVSGSWQRGRIQGNWWLQGFG